MDVTKEQRREAQLDVISSLLVVALLVVVGFMLYLVSQPGVELSALGLLSSYVTRVLLAGFTLLVLLYLWDQRRRLRTEVERKTAEIDTTARWLALSHMAACALGSEGVELGLGEVLRSMASLLGADAAAVLGDDMDSVHVADGVPVGDANRALMHVVVDAAGHAEPMRIDSPGVGGQAVAVPLRVAGELRYMLCAWRVRAPFSQTEIDALGLVGSTIGLAMEREESLAEAKSQLEGTLGVLQFLGGDRTHDYSKHSTDVAELSGRVAEQLGLTPAERKELRLASRLHDVGMMSHPANTAGPGEPPTAEQELVMQQHPRIGAEMALAANFSETVQRAILGHHERLDGTGYPGGLEGTRLSLEARILAVCEAYDSLVASGDSMDLGRGVEALLEIQRGAGVIYDSHVVHALVSVLADTMYETVIAEASPVPPQAKVATGRADRRPRVCVGVPYTAAVA
ncbi:MAG: hypothetical protein C0418_03585 [Coriobacteriaceae bacterium]|nr:hypothetical protein [Coriobacteriaceae bacterium]